MSILRCYNMSRSPMALPGITGTLASAEARAVNMDPFERDQIVEALMLRGPAIGLCAYFLDAQSYIPFWEYGGVRFLQINGGHDFGTTPVLRCVAVQSGAADVYTLPAASALAAGECIRVLVTDNATGALVRRAGADTIDGAATDVTLSLADPLAILRTDGVSAWTTL